VAKPDDIRETDLTYKKNEVTEYHIYRKLAELGYSPENRRDPGNHCFRRTPAFMVEGYTPPMRLLWRIPLDILSGHPFHRNG